MAFFLLQLCPVLFCSAESEQKPLDGRCISDKREWVVGCTLGMDGLGPSPLL